MLSKENHRKIRFEHLLVCMAWTNGSTGFVETSIMMSLEVGSFDSVDELGEAVEK